MQTKPKICILVANEFVYDNAIFYRARALACGGYNVTVVAVMDRGRRLPFYEEKDGVSVRRLRIISRNLRCFEYFIKALAVCLKEKADIYHAAGSVRMLFMGCALARLAKAKLIYDTKDFHSDENAAGCLKDKAVKSAIFFSEGLFIKRADGIIASSDSIAARLKETYDVNLPLTVMECKPFSMVEGSDRIREVLRIPRDEKIILYFGGIVKERGLNVLIEAAGYFDRATTVLIGEGNYKGRLMDIVSDRRLSEKVKFLGRIPFEEIPAYISSADIGVTLFPNDCFNHAYNIDNRFFFYIACGVPVASSDNFERKKLIQEYGLGVIFDIDNPKDIVEKINGLLRDKPLYAKVKNRVIETAKSVLNLENESKKLLDMYKRLCAA